MGDHDTARRRDLVRRIAASSTTFGTPRAGGVVYLTCDASAQFRVPIMFRIIRPDSQPSGIEGWLWLDGYQLDDDGDAVERRSVFVARNGIRYVQIPDQRG